MPETKLISRVNRVLVAFAASVLTGATAGAALARKPLVVRCDDGRPRARRL